MPAWHEDDELWRTLTPFLFDEEKRGQASTEVEGVLNLLGVAPGAKLLDLCCGPGRHAVELARRGFAVTGVDRTASYLDLARGRAAQAGLDIEFVQDDMRRFRRAESFDGAINLYTSFGYFEDPAENFQVLLNLHASLKPGARLVMELMGKEIMARIFAPKDWHELPDGSLFLAEREIVESWNKMRDKWILVRGGERRVLEFTHFLYSGEELAGLLRQAGFQRVSIHGGLDGSPYDRNALRLVAVGERAGASAGRRDSP